MKLTLITAEPVCIGSGTLLEHKLQALNFLNLMHYSIIRGGNEIDVWSHNLKMEVRHLERMIYQSDAPYLSTYKYIDAILLNEIHVKREDSVEYKEDIKKLCLRIWEALVDIVTARYSIKFDRKE